MEIYVLEIGFIFQNVESLVEIKCFTVKTLIKYV